MTDQTQTNFFDTQGQDQPPLLSAGTPRQRIFIYDGQIFSDPGAEHTTRDVLNFLAQDYPELANATWSSRTLPDGTEEITFVKVAGEKGADITPGQLIARLNRVPAAALDAVHLTREFITRGESLQPEEIVARAGQIEAALHQIELVAQKSRKGVERCLSLQPRPHPQVPLGF